MSDEANRGGALSSLMSIAKGAGVFFITSIFSRLLGFVTNVFLARLLGASQYGTYSYANTLVSILSAVGELGSGKSLQRFLPSYSNSPSRQRRVVGIAYGSVVVGGTLIAAAVIVSAGFVSRVSLDGDQLEPVLRIFALLIPLDALIRTVSNTFRGIELPGYQLGIKDVLRPSARLGGVLLAVYLGLSVTGVAVLLVIASIVTLALGLLVLINRTTVYPSLGATGDELRAFYNHSVPLSLSRVGSLLYRRVDILMVGFLLSSSAVGIYNIAFLLTQFIGFPLAAASQIFPSVASRLYDDGDRQQLDSVYSIVTRWTFAGALFIGAVQVIYRSELLSLFGEAFTAGGVVLLVFAVGQVVNAGAGPTNFLLMMTDHQYVVLVNQLVLGGLNIVLNLYFIIRFGIPGAAVATASVIVLQNAIQITEVRYFENLFPYSMAFVKPAIAAGVASAVMLVLRDVVEGILGVTIAGVIGLSVGVVVMVALGPEQEDKEFLAAVVRRMQ